MVCGYGGLRPSNHQIVDLDGPIVETDERGCSVADQLLWSDGGGALWKMLLMRKSIMVHSHGKNM